MKKSTIILFILIILVFSIWIGYIVFNNFNTSKQIASNSLNEIAVSSQKSDLNTNENIFILHKSNLKAPQNELCYKAQELALSDLDENTQKNLKENFRALNWKLEYFLLGEFHSGNLKDSNSPSWNTVINGSFSPETQTYYQGTLTSTLDSIIELKKQFKNEKVINDLTKAEIILREAINNHDLIKVSEVHEIIHDYDYWVVNFPPVELDTEPPDWDGPYTFFGKISIFTSSNPSSTPVIESYDYLKLPENINEIIFSNSWSKLDQDNAKIIKDQNTITNIKNMLLLSTYKKVDINNYSSPKLEKNISFVGDTSYTIQLLLKNANYGIIYVMDTSDYYEIPLAVYEKLLSY